MTLDLSFSSACERNKDPILDAIRPYLDKALNVLEIGTGTGQHAVYFSQSLPHLTWHPSDQTQYLPGIRAILSTASLSNVQQPFELNVTQARWLPDNTPNVDVVYSANTLHIMSWQQVVAFFDGLSRVIPEKGKLIIYGPFKYQGEFTSQSNQQFDVILKQRDLLSGIRDFEEVDRLASTQEFQLLEDVAMPANNQCLIWGKG